LAPAAFSEKLPDAEPDSPPREKKAKRKNGKENDAIQAPLLQQEEPATVLA
jgi:hypothetical protein